MIGRVISASFATPSSAPCCSETAIRSSSDISPLTWLEVTPNPSSKSWHASCNRLLRDLPDPPPRGQALIGGVAHAGFPEPHHAASDDGPDLLSARALLDRKWSDHPGCRTLQTRS